MQVIPNIKPPPRLLHTAATERRDSEANAVEIASRHRLKRSGAFGGNGRAIFIGLLLGALVVVAGGYFSTGNESVDHQLASMRRFLAVRTRAIMIAKPTGDGSAPLAVQISPSMLRVTAIALGHPRMAIINGKEVAEGDSLTLTSPDGGISVTMRILNIVEGRIELTDGTHVITAPITSDKASR